MALTLQVALKVDAVSVISCIANLLTVSKCRKGGLEVFVESWEAPCQYASRYSKDLDPWKKEENENIVTFRPVWKKGSLQISLRLVFF